MATGMVTSNISANRHWRQSGQTFKLVMVFLASTYVTEQSLTSIAYLLVRADRAVLQLIEQVFIVTEQSLTSIPYLFVKNRA
eukprot:2878659-Amphidinium_carterae.2